jgi:hypothetical protein
MTLDKYAKPLRDMPVDQVGTEAVLSVLQPVWQSIPETASRLRGRIEAVLDYAKAHGWRSGENSRYMARASSVPTHSFASCFDDGHGLFGPAM